MKIFITCINGLSGAAQYAQTMVSDIAHQLGFRNMGIFYYNSREESAESLSSRYDGIIAGISPGDIVFFQHPTWHQLRFEEGLIRRIKAYGGRVVMVVHDVEALMFESSRFMLKMVTEIYNSAEVLVVSSYARADMKFAIQEIWDYTTDIRFSQPAKFRKEIHFAGKPSKFLFPDQWNFDVPLKVYASEQCTGENVQVKGWMDSDRLLLELAEGGFGLVWYGNDYWHQYMRYNNSFKLSTYLAAGIPVIVPRGISNQYLIEGNHLGIVADTLEDAAEQVKNISEAEYQEYVRHVREFSSLIRDGYFTKKFLIEAVQMLLRQDMDDYGISGMLCGEKEHFSVMDMQKTLKYVKDRHVSVARFGDGEVDLMMGYSIPYQDYNEELAGRLKQIIMAPDNRKLLVCLPDIFEGRERYTDAFHSFWDEHMKRYQDFYDEIAANGKCYGSTFLSRPYIDLVDKSIAEKHFQNIKELFAEKDILIVEGFYSRSGVGNDLFQGAKSVERIICPSQNAYSRYEAIMNAVRRHGVNKLILLMLGPTAKIMAADLAFEGYWAVDIGHIDSEYEWYRMGAAYKIKLKNKHTAEFNFDRDIELQDDDAYAEEIVEMLSD